MVSIAFCKKCGATVYEVTYKIGDGGKEYLERLCRCGYRWAEKCLDDKTGEP